MMMKNNTNCILSHSLTFFDTLAMHNWSSLYHFRVSTLLGLPNTNTVSSTFVDFACPFITCFNYGCDCIEVE